MKTNVLFIFIICLILFVCCVHNSEKNNENFAEDSIEEVSDYEHDADCTCDECMEDDDDCDYLEDDSLDY